VAKSFISPFEHTNNAYLYTTALLGTFSLNTLYPGGIRTQVFLFPSGCGANCVTPRDGVAPIFLRKDATFYLQKNSLKIRATSVIFKKLLKIKNRPRGKNSPILVTLKVLPN
jgi:hypothetical protein